MRTAEGRERYKEDGRRYPSDLADAEWGLVRSLLERCATLAKDLRVMVGGCLHLAGDEEVGGIERHALTCSFGLVPAVLVSAASLHDTRGLEPLLERAAEAGRDLRRVEADAIHAGPAVRAAAGRHAVEVQVSLRDPAARGFAPLPVRWRIEATLGTPTSRHRRLARNLGQSREAAENVVE